MAEGGPESCGMRTLRRLGWFLCALLLSTMGRQTESAYTSSRQELWDNHYPSAGALSSSQENTAHEGQHMTEARLGPDHLLSLYNRHVQNDPLKKPHTFSQDKNNAKKYDFSRVYYSYMTTRPPNNNADSHRHRRKRQRIRNKTHAGRHAKSRLHKQPEPTPMDSSMDVDYNRGLLNLDVHSHSKTLETSAHTSQTQQPQRDNPPIDSDDEGDHGIKNELSLSSVEYSHKSLGVIKQDDLLSVPAELTADVPESRTYGHDPFLNAPDDRYDLRPARERPAVETTTVLPSFVHGGTRRRVRDSIFLPGPTKVVAHEGGVALLPCAVKYLEMKEVSWGKVGREHFLSMGRDVWIQDARLSVQHREGPDPQESHWDLRIRNVALDDEGQYLCQINANKKSVRTVQLQITEKPPYNPVITIEGKKFVESAHTAYIRCNATEGNRFPEDIDWFKNGDKIDSMSYPNIVITKYRSETTLTLVSEIAIMRASARDSGTYICRSSEELIASLDVNVLVADKSNVKRGHFSNGTTHSDTQTGTDEFIGNSSPNRRSGNLFYFFVVWILCLICQSNRMVS